MPPYAATIFVLAAVTSAGAAVVDPPPVPVVVRLYGGEALPLQGATREADRILGDAGLAAAWVVCARTPQGEERCASPLSGAEFAVRLVDAAETLPVRGSLPLGYALVDTTTGAGSLATVFLNRVRWLATAAERDPGVLLGRALVHELGHLLLGTGSHAAAGVMRGVWSRAAVRDDRNGEWHFERPAARRMREAARVRSGETGGGRSPSDARAATRRRG